MDNFQSHSDQSTTFSPSTLLCKEPNISFDEEEIEIYSSLDAFDGDDDQEKEEYVKMLFDKEIPCANEDQIVQDWIKEARFNAIQYILNITTIFRFKLLTAYTSISYFDTFLSRRHIDVENSWAMNLLAVACLSLAAKMEECEVPSLPEFAMEEFSFESKVIQKMELLILSTLEWKMITITPFSFINFIIPKFGNDSSPSNIKPMISELIFRLIKDVNLMSYRQSVIGAAMTLMALDPRLSKEAMETRLRGLSSCLPVHIEEVWSCYNKMQVIDTQRLNKSSKCIISPPLSPTQFPNLGHPSNSSPAIGSKRKILGFNECDQNSDNFPPNDENKRQI
ncbi:kinase activator [Lithospermum erythrorhizon]|uniref:Kinase activator n=1 Tax=Lithospermum erythrorhizon TaxID=34254 RepID=A0AAV3QJD2_LITER